MSLKRKTIFNSAQELQDDLKILWKNGIKIGRVVFRQKFLSSKVSFAKIFFRQKFLSPKFSFVKSFFRQKFLSPKVSFVKSFFRQSFSSKFDERCFWRKIPKNLVFFVKKCLSSKKVYFVKKGIFCQ